MRYIMKNLEKNYLKIFNFLIFAISITLIFREISTFLILLFTVFNLLFIKKLQLNKKKLIWILIISSPLLLDILFFWNNSNFITGIKATEKHLSLLLFPLFLVGHKEKIDFKKVITQYAYATCIILIVLFIRYIIVYNENFMKYLSGKHLWEMGYHFTKSFDIHAPWLNLHVSFFSIISFYLLVINWTKHYIRTIGYVMLFVLSFFFVLYINTRTAVVSTVIGFFIIAFMELIKGQNKKTIIKRITALIIFVAISLTVFVKVFPYSLKKYSSGTFSNLDKIGRLDEFENPEKEVYNKLVTRLSIWKSSIELAKKSPIYGYGAADSKTELYNYYEDTNQKFLSKFQFQVHNQFLDFFLKYGVLGLICVFMFLFGIGYIGLKLKNPIIISFFLLFFLANITDDFLIIYSGIAFSGLWFSIFANNYYFNKT